MKRRFLPVLLLLPVLALASLACQFAYRAIGIQSGAGPEPVAAMPLATEQPASASQPDTAPVEVQPPILEASAPGEYSGWMAGRVYQGYVNVTIGETRVEQLDTLMGMTGKRSTDSWKPRDNHADTFIYTTGQDNMVIYISVTTDGIVYKKSISSKTRPGDYSLASVTSQAYDELDAIYKRDKAIPYAVMAELLKSPGFLREAILMQDGRFQTIYEWYAPNGDRISGIFFEGLLTGMAGLAYIPAE
jgi:hypothetical protein